MPTEPEIPLRDLARFAAQYYIKGKTFKRNSLLKPLDIILEELDRSNHPDNPAEIALIRAGTKTLIRSHMERIAGIELGRKMVQIDEYVDRFFDGVLGQMHHGRVSQLLARAKLLRAAYLLWIRQQLAAQFVERGLARDQAQALDTMEETEEDETLAEAVLAQTGNGAMA